MTFEEGERLINQIKSTVAGLEPDWKSAKDRALRTPRGDMNLEMRHFGSILQGTSFDEGLASSINSYLTRTGPRTGAAQFALAIPEALNMLLRGLRATADVSFMGIQGVIGLVHEPGAYRHALQGGVRAMLDPLHGKYVLGKFIDDFDRMAIRKGIPTAAEWTAAGLRMGGIDTEFMIGSRVGHGLAQLPVAKQANRAFGYFGDILRLDGAQSQFNIRKLNYLMPNQRRAAMEKIAMSQNLMTGWAPRRFGSELGVLLQFAPRFFESQIELVVRGLTDRSITGAEARAMLLKFVGAGTLLTVAANEQFGDERFDYLTPFINGKFNSNLMRFRAMGQDISLFGPWDSLVRAFVYAAQGDLDYLARTKASPSLGLLWDTLTGETFTGDRAPMIKNLVKDSVGEFKSVVAGTEYEGSGDFDLLPEYFLRSISPFSLQGIFEGQSPIQVGLGTTGLKATPLTPAEQRDQLQQKVIQELIDAGKIPDHLAETFKSTPYFEMSSAEKKLIDRWIKEKYPEQETQYREARRKSENIYQAMADQADGARDVAWGRYDKLFEALKNGTAPDVIWEAYDDERNKLAGRLAQVYEGGIDKETGKRVASKETLSYQAEVAKLRATDMRKLEDSYNGLIVKNEKAPNIFDWDKIDREQVQFIRDLAASDPELAKRFVNHLQLKEQFDAEDAHPLVQFKRLIDKSLQPYYDLKDREAKPEELKKWLLDHPDADFGMWMVATWENPSVHSVRAAAKAIAIPGREVHLVGSNQKITKGNLPILQRYDKEITQLLTMPTSAKDSAGKNYSPRTELRKNDPLYDALYYWLGFSNPDEEGSVVAYHDLTDFISSWGPRSDKVPWRRPR